MSKKRVKSKQFDKIMKEALKGIVLDASKITNEIAKETADDIAVRINRRVDQFRWRSLKNTWKVAEDLRGENNTARVRLDKVYVVHAENYRLPHLLEFSHPMPQGGKSKAYETIQPAAREAFEKLEQRIPGKYKDLK